MNNVAQYYRQLMSSLTERLKNGERDINLLVGNARAALKSNNQLTHSEVDQLTYSVRRDLQEFARNYVESKSQSVEDDNESVFMRVIKGSLWQELADITDKTKLEWREVFKDVNHHGVYHSGEVVGLGNLVCEKCQFNLAVYTPEILTRCPECGHTEFTRHPFEP